ncbi:alpha/beta fold hydrolase [Chloroflexota bacterium]
MPEVKVNGTSIYYEVNGEGHPLVFIHAGALESSSWHPQIVYFSTRYRVITYDIRGHGRSGFHEEGYSVDDCIEDLRQLLDHLAVHQTYFAGLSMGGHIALKFTLLYPERVAALIVAGTNSGPMTDRVVSLHGEMAARLRATKGTDSATKYLRAYEANATRPDITDRLSEISRPVLILVGDQDMSSPHYISEEMHRRIANSQMVVLPNCGHKCNQDQPDVFNSTVSDFLQRIEDA